MTLLFENTENRKFCIMFPVDEQLNFSEILLKNNDLRFLVFWKNKQTKIGSKCVRIKYWARDKIRSILFMIRGKKSTSPRPKMKNSEQSLQEIFIDNFAGIFDSLHIKQQWHYFSIEKCQKNSSACLPEKNIGYKKYFFGTLHGNNTVKNHDKVKEERRFRPMENNRKIKRKGIIVVFLRKKTMQIEFAGCFLIFWCHTHSFLSEKVKIGKEAFS